MTAITGFLAVVGTELVAGAAADVVACFRDGRARVLARAAATP